MLITSVKTDRRGFSLIEIMIAMLIMLISTLGVYGVIAVSMQANASNTARDEAVSIAAQVVNEFRSRKFEEVTVPGCAGISPCAWTPADIQAELGYVNGQVVRQVRRAQVTYTLGVTVVDHPAPPATADLKDVQVSVNWTYAGRNLTHMAATVLRRFEI